MSDGRTHSEKMTLPPAPVAEEFSPSEVVAAIGGAQADTIRYREFVKRSVAAGVFVFSYRKARYLLRAQRLVPQPKP
jgi:hypothetical protein